MTLICVSFKLKRSMSEDGIYSFCLLLCLFWVEGNVGSCWKPRKLREVRTLVPQHVKYSEVQISLSKAASVYQQAVHLVPTGLFCLFLFICLLAICQSRLTKARFRESEPKTHTPSTSTKGKVMFGPTIRNTVFRMEGRILLHFSTRLTENFLGPTFSRCYNLGGEGTWKKVKGWNQ